MPVPGILRLQGRPGPLLEPLRGAELVCDCRLGCFCHTSVLVEYVDKVQQCVVIPGDSKLDTMSEACVMEGFEEDDDDDKEIAPAPRFNADVAAVNETVRSGASTYTRKDRRGYLRGSAFSLLYALPLHLCFGRFVSGKAGLTREFLRQEWPCGPPIDILYNADYDVLNPLFFCIMLGLIFERLIRVIHLGPPCSSFSLAVNRFKSYAMRSAKFPAGFKDLHPHREEKVRLGNALAEISRKAGRSRGESR